MPASELDVRAFPLGPLQTNCYVVRAGAGADEAIVVDPGEEPDRLEAALAALGTKAAAILITHCHFDHIGAVAQMARRTGAPVHCPEVEQRVLADIASFTPPGFGPFEPYAAERLLAGGELLKIADIDVQVLATPGHSPGHLTYAMAPAAAGAEAGDAPATQAPEGGAPPRVWAIFCGDVLFKDSVGRVDLPGGDWSVLERSIEAICRRYAPESVVYPGHMGATTLARELAANPFLTGMAERLRAGASS